MGGVLGRLFKVKKLELVLVGIENSGKSTLLNMMAMGTSIQTVPTVGLSVKTMKHAGVSMKAWDLGGSAQFRSEWGRYTRGCDVILFLVDTNDRERLPLARKELHALLEDPELQKMPLLVLGNKIDLEPHMSKEEIIKGLNLDYIQDQPWECMAISGLRGMGVERVIDWLIAHARK